MRHEKGKSGRPAGLPVILNSAAEVTKTEALSAPRNDRFLLDDDQRRHPSSAAVRLGRFAGPQSVASRVDAATPATLSLVEFELFDGQIIPSLSGPRRLRGAGE